jgi:hypothetical protein
MPEKSRRALRATGSFDGFRRGQDDDLWVVDGLLYPHAPESLPQCCQSSSPPAGPGHSGWGYFPGGYGQDELERADAYRVYQDPADLLRHLDEVGVRVAE